MANKKHYHYNRNRRPKGENASNSQIDAQVAKYSEAQLMMTLSELGLCDATCTLLDGNKITKSADLVKRTEKDMYKVQGLNKRILFEIKDALKKNGMSLCPDLENKKSQNANQDNGKKKPVESEKNQHVVEQKNEDKKSKFGLVDRHEPKNNQKAQKQQKQKQEKSQKQDKSQKQEKLLEPLKAGQWRKVLKGGKWGYSDGFKIVIPTMYDEIFAFKEGLASVEINEKCGYINEQNEVVIGLDYDTAMSFSEGLAMVVKGDKCGYINQNNEVIIPFEYDAGTPFEDGEAKIKKDGKWGTITKEGKITWI